MLPCPNLPRNFWKRSEDVRVQEVPSVARAISSVNLSRASESYDKRTSRDQVEPPALVQVARAEGLQSELACTRRRRSDCELSGGHRDRSGIGPGDDADVERDGEALRGEAGTRRSDGIDETTAAGREQLNVYTPEVVPPDASSVASQIWFAPPVRGKEMILFPGVVTEPKSSTNRPVAGFTI